VYSQELLCKPAVIESISADRRRMQSRQNVTMNADAAPADDGLTRQNMAVYLDMAEKCRLGSVLSLVGNIGRKFCQGRRSRGEYATVRAIADIRTHFV